MSIMEEQELKNKYLLVTEEFEGLQIVKLTTDNIARVEAMIMTDSGYAKSGDINAGPTYKKNGEEKYSGSTAYWMTKLKYALENNCDDDLRTIISHAVNAIDKENSTHINSDGVGRKQLTNRILAKVKSLKEILLNVDSGLKFIDEIATITSDVDAKHKARTNLSFASKFAHYACFYLFDEDDPRRDNFSIYDNVLNKALPIYIKKYNLDGYNPNSYLSYYKCIGEIIKACGEDLSRNVFDHLIWYYYKARLNSIKLNKVKNTAAKTREKSSTCFNTADIYEYILSIKEKEKNQGKCEITLIARDIARYFGRYDRMVSICSAMRKAMNPGDVIVYTPPKGNSTTLEIKYYLK
ncbi:MAG: hypothetical protein ACI311_05725 [Bacilli bacterium]